MKLLLSLLLSLFVSQSVLAAAPPSSDQAEAVKGSNAFAVDLYGRLSAQARQSLLLAGKHLHGLRHGLRWRARPDGH